METADYIVGIGASAGGLEAINQLFDNMPENSDAAFVIVQHLSPDYKSLMPELLAKHTLMQVYEAVNGMTINSNCVYLIPSKKIMTIRNGLLKLVDKEVSKAPNFAIDVFFESLAKEKGKSAVAIILSGTGTDGTKGSEAIRNNGGFVIVQEPMSALFDGMPNSAIHHGFADMILPPDMMPEELVSYIKEAPLNRLFNTQEDERILLDILALVKRATTYDFINYKRPTLYRRIAKRMMEQNYKSLAEYFQVLINEPDEIRALLKELLINVTRFFRDEEAFEIIKSQVIPALFSSKKQGDTIKVWVTACSSGEEAYSLAILFEEFRQRHNIQDVHVKIFATDIDAESLEAASKGAYSRDQLNNISKERIQKFFDREGDIFKVIAPLRKMVVVAKHNIVNDPPFSRLDLITCRNMLIYMNPLLQKNILRTFHFAVNEGGYIFLGPSENIDILKDAVKEIDRKWKIFKCIRKINLQDNKFLLTPLDKQSFYQPTVEVRNKAKNALFNLAEVFKDTLLEAYSFAGIFIDREYEVKQAIGNYKEFLNFPEGQFNFSLLKMVPQELSIALGTSIRKAIQNNENVILKKVKIHDGGSVYYVNVIVKPYLQNNEYIQPFLFVILNKEEEEEKTATAKYSPAGTTEALYNVEELEKELKETRENLQAVIEELESANEELQSHTEEMIASNEELQSTNEELQSLNEELHTVSAEHQMKIKELLELNDDLNNYFRTSNIGQMVVDKKLIIKRFSPGIVDQINLVEADLGRSIADFSTKILNADFVNNIKEVLKTGTALEKETKLHGGRFFLMRIHPYIRLDKTIDGVVITFYDVTEIRKLNNIIEGVFNSSMNGIMALKAVRNKKDDITDFEVITVNTRAEELLQYTHGAMAGKSLLELFPEAGDIYFDAYISVIETGESLHVEYLQESQDRWLELVAVKMEDGVVITFNDITERKRATEIIAEGYENLKVASRQLMESNHDLEQSNFDLMQFASVASHDLKEPLRKIQIFGHSLDDKIKDKINEEEKLDLQRILKAATRMQKLIEDILTLSKLSNKEISYAPTDLNAIISNLFDDLEIIIKERNAKIETAELPVIDALSGQMHQLFQNLIINALKFNSNPQPTITITQETVGNKEIKSLNLEEGNSYVRIIIADNGIGFSEEYKDKIFGVFQRLHGSEYSGTGIGLAIAKKIIENHDGLIEAESTVNEGSRFIITLPLNHKNKKNLIPADPELSGEEAPLS